ncbi:MAG: cation/H(+) antiporter [Frankiales bacterium]|nr:cation/H(+) antiporter [Frankiales bacterium]
MAIVRTTSGGGSVLISTVLAAAAPVLKKPPSITDDQIAQVFLDIAIIVVVARLVGMAFVKLRQPAVIGEIIAGISLGPSLLGQLPGHLDKEVFPTDVRPYLKLVANVGLIIFMFIVGLELDVKLIRGKEKAAAAISLSSVALPFGLGVLLALWLHDRHGVVDGKAVKLLPFALFIGASMSVTAFPVLARILTDRGMHRTQIGALTLACAAVDDILAWSMLAVVLAVVNSTGSLDLPIILAETLAFVAVLFLVVKPLLKRLVPWFERSGRLTPNILAVIVVGFLLSAYITDHIGIHAIFGAFVFGVVMPREGSQALLSEILDKLEQVSVLLFLPVFFISTGFGVDVTGLGADGLNELAAVLAVAIVGKFVGASLAARGLGFRARKAAAVGLLMNTRGLTELVILNVGVTAHVLDAKLFTILVMMAIVTTVMTEPLLRLVYPDKMLARDVAEAERLALGIIDAYRVVAVVEPQGSEPLVEVGVALLGREEPSELLLTRFEKSGTRNEVGAGLLSQLSGIAAGFEALQALVRQARAAGAQSQVRSQASADPAQDLLLQAEAVEADVLVLSPDDPSAATVLAGADCTVILATGGYTEGPVSVRPGPGDDGLAAIEQALRIALRHNAPLVLVVSGDKRNDKRAEELLPRLQSIGMTVSSGPASGLTVAGKEGGGPAQLLVRGRKQDKGESLFRLVDELTAAPAR